jgi:hypothetical protein
MKPRFKQVLFVLSLALNAAFAVLLAASLALAGKRSSLSFDSLDTQSRPYLTSAAVVSVPADSGHTAFGCIEISMKKFDTAAITFPVMLNKKQANWRLNLLYDHSVVSTAPSGTGVTITARSQGDTTMQILTDEGIRDVVKVTVIE